MPERPSSGTSNADLDHLFRHEAGRMVAAVTRLFGLHNLALAEDVVQDALCRALEVWKFSGVPNDPSGWLLAAARNRAIDMLRRDRTVRAFAPDLAHVITTEWTLVPAVKELFREEEIHDDVLRMMFSCCSPRIAEETQIALVLHLLGGFGVHEVAQAFLVSPAAMEKRLQRGKQALAELGALVEVSAARVTEHLDAVLRALYVLFSEGYHGGHVVETVRAELCTEAMRLCATLDTHPKVGSPKTKALLALMCLHAARLPARADAQGELLPFDAQDRSRWDQALVARGLATLDASATGDVLTTYHVEAAIAAEHVMASSAEAIRWDRVVGHYDVLAAMDASPVVALNRAIALGQLHGPSRGLAAIAAIDDRERLASYPFFHAAIAEFHLRAGEPERAARHFRDALEVARSPSERRFLEQRIAAAEARPSGQSAGRQTV